MGPGAYDMLRLLPQSLNAIARPCVEPRRAFRESTRCYPAGPLPVATALTAGLDSLATRQGHCQWASARSFGTRARSDLPPVHGGVPGASGPLGPGQVRACPHGRLCSEFRRQRRPELGRA